MCYGCVVRFVDKRAGGIYALFRLPLSLSLFVSVCHPVCVCVCEGHVVLKGGSTAQGQPKKLREKSSPVRVIGKQTSARVLCNNTPSRARASALR